MVIPLASHFPDGSVKASVAIVSPAAMPGRSACFCSSVPALRMALAARQTDEKNGAHSSARPISSSTTTSSTKEKPCPP